jgi:hypothetical protein
LDPAAEVVAAAAEVVVAAEVVAVAAVAEEAEMADWYSDELRCCRRLPRRRSGKWVPWQRLRRPRPARVHACDYRSCPSSLLLVVRFKNMT